MTEATRAKRNGWSPVEGDRVIVRSNEDNPLEIGTFLSLNMHSMPVVRFDSDGKEWMCMGIVLPYSTALLTELEPMTPTEQWEHLRRKR